MQLAHEAKKSEADYFTFQIFEPTSFCVEDYERFDIVKSIAFEQSEWGKLIDYCNSIELEIIPCALDIKSFEFCYDKGLRIFKIHATDIGNVPFLKTMQDKSDLQVLLETQCATFQDIAFSLKFIGDKLLAIIHGYSNYPTEVEDLNLNALDYITKEFRCAVGFADHSLDISEIPLMAMAKGAEYLEKHITISRRDRHYDWQVSLYPDEFKAMVNNLKHYEKALGKSLKHPSKNEADFRGVLYKKVIDNNLNLELKRADQGNDYLTQLFHTFPKDRIGVGIIARLKSKRLKRKVLKPFHEGAIIEDLYHRIGTATGISDIAVITSDLEEDTPLAEFCEKTQLNVFRGHPESVIDRMLSFILETQIGTICRVTGDNPFSDPEILEAMIKLMIEEELDYVKVNNVPIGVGVELYSSAYLWDLYLRLENPLTSEYLAWIALNDEHSSKGCIDIEFPDNHDLKYYNLSVDYQKDFDRCKKVLNAIGKNSFNEIKLKDILNSMKEIDPSDKQMTIKLPKGKTCTFEEFNNLIDQANYKHRNKLIVK